MKLWPTYPTNPKSFSSLDALRYGVQATFKHIWFSINIVLILLLINIVPALYAARVNSILSITLGLRAGLFVFSLIISLGIIRTTLKVVDDSVPSTWDLFKTGRFVEYGAAALFYLGLILLGAGLIITIPLTLVAYSYAYRQLKK